MLSDQRQAIPLIKRGTIELQSRQPNEGATNGDYDKPLTKQVPSTAKQFWLLCLWTTESWTPLAILGIPALLGLARNDQSSFLINSSWSEYFFVNSQKKLAC